MTHFFLIIGISGMQNTHRRPSFGPRSSLFVGEDIQGVRVMKRCRGRDLRHRPSLLKATAIKQSENRTFGHAKRPIKTHTCQWHRHQISSGSLSCLLTAWKRRTGAACLFGWSHKNDSHGMWSAAEQCWWIKRQNPDKFLFATSCAEKPKQLFSRMY